MLIARTRIAPPSRIDVELALPFEQRQKSRLRATATNGEAIGLMLERGTVLRGGDCLQGDDGRVVRVVAADEDLCEARCADGEALARAAWHLGNRHTPVQVGAGWLRLTADPVLAQMLRGLGATVAMIRAPFEPEAGAYAGAHPPPVFDAKRPGVIHDFAPMRSERR